MQKIFCDRCLKEIKSNSELRRINIGNSGGRVYELDGKSYGNETIKADICRECACEIIGGFREELISS